MDPDTTLQELRALAHELIFCDEDNREKLEANAVRTGELIQALDEWITKGGFLPEAWQKASK